MHASSDRLLLVQPPPPNLTDIQKTSLLMPRGIFQAARKVDDVFCVKAPATVVKAAPSSFYAQKICFDGHHFSV